MKVSVIIPTYKRTALLQELLHSLTNQTFAPKDFEVIIVDDASPDAEEKKQNIMSDSRPYSLNYVIQTKGGPAKARNRAVSLAKGEYVLMVDDDAIANHNWIAEHYTTLKNAEYAGVAGKTCGYESNTLVARYFDHVGHLGGHLFDKNGNVLYLVTVNAGFKKSAFTDVGGFNENFPHAAGEDVDLGFRMLARGHKFAYNPKALVFHRHPKNLKGLVRTSFLYGRGAYRCAKINSDTESSGKMSSEFTNIMDIPITIKNFFVSIYKNLHDENISIYHSFAFPILGLVQYFFFHMGRVFEHFSDRKSIPG